jgi:hypothetical protein
MIQGAGWACSFLFSRASSAPVANDVLSMGMHVLCSRGRRCNAGLNEPMFSGKRFLSSASPWERVTVGVNTSRRVQRLTRREACRRLKRRRGIAATQQPRRGVLSPKPDSHYHFPAPGRAELVRSRRKASRSFKKGSHNSGHSPQLFRAVLATRARSSGMFLASGRNHNHGSVRIVIVAVAR